MRIGLEGGERGDDGFVYRRGPHCAEFDLGAADLGVVVEGWPGHMVLLVLEEDLEVGLLHYLSLGSQAVQFRILPRSLPQAPMDWKRCQQLWSGIN